MKRKSELIEGPEAWGRFDAFVRKLMTVPHSVIQQREAEHRRQVEANPNRRGPKRKPKTVDN